MEGDVARPFVSLSIFDMITATSSSRSSGWVIQIALGEV
jgi:hypothetical protein